MDSGCTVGFVDRLDDPKVWGQSNWTGGVPISCDSGCRRSLSGGGVRCPHVEFETPAVILAVRESRLELRSRVGDKYGSNWPIDGASRLEETTKGASVDQEEEWGRIPGVGLSARQGTGRKTSEGEKAPAQRGRKTK